MSRRLLVVNGHPDPRSERFCAALCNSYAEGARSAGWETDRLDVGSLDRTPPVDADRPSSPELAAAIERIRRADRLAIIFPLWLDGPPGSLRELFELSAREIWSAEVRKPEGYDKPAQLIVTMDMPAFIQRPRARPEGPQPSILSLPGVRSSEPIYVGSLQALTAAQRDEWLEKVRLLGAQEK